MGEFGFGKQMGLLESSKDRFILEVMHLYSCRMGFYEQFPAVAKLKLESIFEAGQSLLNYRTRLQKEWEIWSQDFSTFVLDKNRGMKKGLFSLILDSKDPGTDRGPALQNLWAEGSFLMLAGTSGAMFTWLYSTYVARAGSDTSATTLSAALFYLAHYPEVYHRLVSEVRLTFNDAEKIRSGLLLQSCTYLHACINETMRMSPSTPGAPWREVQKGGAIIDGMFIPAGYDVGTCIYSIHHCEEYFPQSYTFIPERWIPRQFTSPEQLEVAYEAFNPFSTGPRGCPGRSLATLEICLTLARIIWEYDFRLAEGGLGRVGEGVLGNTKGRHRTDEFQLRTHVTASSKGPLLQFRRHRRAVEVSVLLD